MNLSHCWINLVHDGSKCCRTLNRDLARRCLAADPRISRVGDPQYLAFYTETPQHFASHDASPFCEPCSHVLHTGFRDPMQSFSLFNYHSARY